MVAGTAFLVSMQQEMYKDALHFFREAKKNDATVGADPFTTWRGLRASILFAFAAIESGINQFIDASLRGTSQRKRRFWRRIPIAEKLNEGMELYGGKPLENDATLWDAFEEFRGVRNSLVHYDPGKSIFYDTQALIVKVESCIRTSSAVLKWMYMHHPQNSGYPPTFDEMP